MISGNNTNSYPCLTRTLIVAMTLSLLAIPWQILLMKILVKDFRLSLPRHIILFSVSLSDGIQICAVFILPAIANTSNLTTEDNACLYIRKCVVFFAILTFTASCLSILAMSFERYIACLHSFRLHQILTEPRVRYGFIFVWIISILLASTETFLQSHSTGEVEANGVLFYIIYITFTILTLVVIIFVQIRLFLFSKTKISRVNPAGAFGAQLELADYRKKHIKVALVAGIVAIGFAFCCVPIAIVFLYEMVNGVEVASNLRTACIGCKMANALANPFIYGFGIADTRRVLKRDIKRMTQYLVDIFLR